MFIYNGKLNWFDLVEKEDFTIVVPAGFAQKDPICAHWQWTIDPNNRKGKQNTSRVFSMINNIINTVADEYKFSFSFGYYSFDAVVSRDFRTLSTTMRNPKNDRSGPHTLILQYSDTSRIPSTVVYTGKIDWLHEAVNEMITLVIPSGVSALTNGSFVGMYHQWTVDSAGNKKGSHPINSNFDDVSTSSDGDITGTFSDGNRYTYEVTVFKDRPEVKMVMSDKVGHVVSISLKQTDFRELGTKKALLARVGTGTDNGIFSVQEMLTNHLGFSPGNVEMLYFDIEEQDGIKQATRGQDPPTATLFREKFARLISTASAGDVCFLYLDARRAVSPGGGSSRSSRQGEGWDFAEDGQGETKEVVHDDWIRNTVRENLKPGINLTVLTTSGVGGGMFKKQTATPGIFLAGCDEAQHNVKALKQGNDILDPWSDAITKVIAKRVEQKRGVPSYTILFNETKKYIEKQLKNGPPLCPTYRGPSPDETKPLPYEPVWMTSNQDPQLMLYDGYVDPDTEKFLCPFVAANGGSASGEFRKYPRDEVYE